MMTKSMIICIYALLFFLCWNCGQQSEQTLSNTNITTAAAPTTPKILGGTAVPADQWKSVVALTDKLSGRYFCSGVLIDKERLLTAAHCLKGRNVIDNVTVYLGEGVEGGEFVGEHTIKSYTIHPKMDIALATLSAPIDVDCNFDREFIPMATPALIKVGAKIKFIGFGQRRVLGYAEYDEGQIIPKGVKYEVNSSISSIVTDAETKAMSTITWNQAYETYYGHFSGDSGGPVLIFDPQKKQWFLVAIISGGRSNAYNSGTDVLIFPHLRNLEFNCGQ
ncbi:MAG: trypsin-like serine protease [Oligoflexia bacterium]|nr:trypsin-like serine protease [Oligoflexia bacterium]MBF0367620.1 trypsin-like serine protease [Oligoflexia bacterium]